MVLPLVALGGLTAAAGIGSQIFGRKAAKRARAEQEAMAKKMAEERNLLIDKSVGELAIDPAKMKEQYNQAMMRNLQQQAGGATAALASQRGVNPALASHMLTSSNVEREAIGAGEAAFQTEKIGFDADMYNKQLKQYELGLRLGTLDQQQSANQQAMMMEQQMRMQGQQQMFNIIGQGAGAAMRLYGGAQTSPDVSGGSDYVTSQAPSRFSLGVDPGMNMNMSGYAPQYPGMGFYSDENLKKPWEDHENYSQLISAMHGG